MGVKGLALLGRMGFKRVRLNKHSSYMKCNKRQKPAVAASLGIVASISILVQCANPVSAFAETSSYTQSVREIVTAAKQVKLPSVFVPDLENKEQSKYTYHSSAGLLIIDTPKYRLMESTQKVLLDSPNERERLTESINGSQSADMDTYLLPGGNALHVLTLHFEGMWVFVLPKWTNNLSNKGFAATEESRTATLRDLEKVVFTAKNLKRISVR